MYGNYPNRLNESRKAAIYARVSTEHEEQLSALENQKDWYKPILEQHPEWEIVQMYVDEGVTGTSAKKRKNFLKMISDAEYGKFDLILTREVSRFARNTVDTLQYTRSLKAKGVEVYFINDNIRTFDGDGELRLTIMATLAQDESRKTSIRVKAGQQTSMENGVYYGNGSILGYDRVGKETVINPEQAKTVRMIYNWYLAGEGLRSIQFKLEQAGRLTAMGKTTWHMTNISKILKNTFYCGIITYHKQWTPDYLEQKKINNHGEIEKTVVQGTHEPIVTVEEFEAVQKRFQMNHKEHPESGAGQKREYTGQPIDIWTELLICECGHHFSRRFWHTDSKHKIFSYLCYGTIKSGSVKTRQNKGLPIEGICSVPNLPSWKLEMMAKRIFSEFSKDVETTMDFALSILDKHIDDKKKQKDNSDRIRQYNNERAKLEKRHNNLVEMRADGEITKEVYRSKVAEINSRLKTIEDEIVRLESEEEQKQNNYSHEEKITLLKYHLYQMVNPGEGGIIPDGLLRAFVSKIVVHMDSLDWYLRFRPDDSPATDEPQKIAEYSFTKEDAKKYLYSYSRQRRVLKWFDIKAAVFI